jgi:hypothetical protein
MSILRQPLTKVVPGKPFSVAVVFGDIMVHYISSDTENWACKLIGNDEAFPNDGRWVVVGSVMFHSSIYNLIALDKTNYGTLQVKESPEPRLPTPTPRYDSAVEISGIAKIEKPTPLSDTARAHERALLEKEVEKLKIALIEKELANHEIRAILEKEVERLKRALLEKEVANHERALLEKEVEKLKSVLLEKEREIRVLNAIAAYEKSLRDSSDLY